ncbi:uncharacterized protein LOC108847561 [Raphanus sativus]|uniref:Uncharacterized protein LOC108847561 n=1 Tax=Raphanus sativus TaxID=3726 RepID=A0A9W3C4D1_RAPSA|nr:uncharacterized protein LOC108847561 [Raphanus sativus]
MSSLSLIVFSVNLNMLYSIEIDFRLSSNDCLSHLHYLRYSRLISKLIRYNAKDETKGKKRKHDSDAELKENSSDEDEKRPKEMKIMKRAKNVNLCFVARELKSIRSDLSFIQESCGLLEEENKRLREGFVKSVRPEEDDPVRLQLEVLLTEKARLANENANLVRENQCLRQLVEYHQITSSDLFASYEQVVQGLCLDLSSPFAEIDYEHEEEETTALHVSKSLNESFDKAEEEQDC